MKSKTPLLALFVIIPDLTAKYLLYEVVGIGNSITFNTLLKLGYIPTGEAPLIPVIATALFLLFLIFSILKSDKYSGIERNGFWLIIGGVACRLIDNSRYIIFTWNDNIHAFTIAELAIAIGGLIVLSCLLENHRS